ncbi:MAG: hypothetical protein K8W52_37405 [Deltaproteobacteria bacterium]|nr:hypothetical protein [Deltaproteobacteria bacterium]
MRGEPLSVEALSDITSSATRWELAPRRPIVALAFTGTYRDGSRGSPDAARMRAHVAAAIEAWAPDGIVLDFAALRYRWGDGLIGVFETVSRGALVPRPSAIVRGPDSAAGLGSLCSSEALFDDLETAVRSVNDELMRRRDEEARIEDRLAMAIVISERLGIQDALAVAARAPTAYTEHHLHDWVTRLWQIDVARVEIYRGSDDDLAWAAALPGALAIAHAGHARAAVALRPAAEWPLRLTSTPRW